MDMLGTAQIAAAHLKDWCQLAQGLHARYLIDDFEAGARFLVDIGEVGTELGHHPRVTMDAGHVDLKLVSDDAIYREGETEYIVQWVTQKDLDLAQRFHLEVYVTLEVAPQRIAAAVAAGGTVVDDGQAPSLVVIADQDGNRGAVCAPAPAAGTRD